jgi:hypothetical protein
MGSRTAFAIVGWLVAAAAATVVGLGAVRVIGEGIAGTAPTTLTREEVAEALASPVPPTSPSPTASPSPDPAETSATKPPGTLLKHTGGQVMAHCVGDLVVLEWWSPSPGYQVTDGDHEPAAEAEITFDRGGEGRGSGEVEVHIGCEGGKPRIVRIDD